MGLPMTVLGAVGYYIVTEVIGSLITGTTAADDIITNLVPIVFGSTKSAPFGSDPNCKVTKLGGHLNRKARQSLAKWSIGLSQFNLLDASKCVTTRG